MAEGELVEVDDQTWEKTIEKGEKPIVVMFYSPTCAYCQSMEPFFQQYAREFKETVVFARLNIITNQWTAEKFGVRGTPTFKFFCSGKPVFELTGAVYPAILKKMVEEILEHGESCAKNRTEINYDITGYG
jgi:thioredoxin-like negative regulator of GroEL